MSANNKTVTFQSSPQGQLTAHIDAELIGTQASAREGYSEQESRFLKYLASKGHIGGTA